MNRPKIGIVIDYVLRNPNFSKSYNDLKKVLMGDDDTDLTFEDNEDVNSWMHIKRNDPETYNFYIQTKAPKEEAADFDITWKKYFPTPEQRQKFLLEYAFNLFGQGSVISKSDIYNINLIQSKLADVILFDRTQHTRKIMNTFGFLSRSGLIIKGVEFVKSDDEIKAIEDNFIGIYNPFINDKQKIFEPSKNEKGIETHSQNLMDFFLECERKINNR